MPRATGIEITEGSVRVIEAEGTARKLRIHGSSETRVEGEGGSAGNAEALSEAIRAGLKEAKAKRETVVVGLPSNEATIREIVIPFQDAEQIRKVIKFESEQHLPTANIDEVIVGWHKVAESGPRSRVLIFVIEKARLRHYMEALTKAGLEPSQIDLSCTALFSLTRLLSPFAEDDADPDRPLVHAIFDFGRTSTTLMLTRGDQLQLVRVMRLGSESLVRGIAQDLGVETEEARRITDELLSKPSLPFATEGDVVAADPLAKQSASALSADVIKDRQSALAQRFATELRRSLSSVGIDGTVDGIWMTGATSHSAAVERALEEEFEVRVGTLPTTEVADHSMPATFEGIAGPGMGLALKGLEHDPLRLDFRQEEFRFARRFERIRGPLLAVACCALVLVAFAGIHMFQQQQLMERKLKKSDDYAANIFENTVVATVTALDKQAPSITGYEDLDAPATFLSQAKAASKEGSLSLRLLQHLQQGPRDYLITNFGIGGNDGESAETPERRYQSVLARGEDFFKALQRAAPKIKPFQINKLRFEPNQIRFTMRTGTTGAWAHVRPELERIANVIEAKQGTNTTDGTDENGVEWRKFVGCVVSFDPDSQP